ncbi:MAG: ATP-dependent helicase [Anaerosomatales bacterium]|nr:ATP-dependent helicase [Anaerosomatales bacterium]MDT8434477.1 ATP-dependent helicase [Anaerosomatales bacterium]
MDHVTYSPPTDQDTLAHLDERQRAAVTHGDGPLLIVAGAGTGKTLTLAHRVAHLVERGADPARITLLTFTRRAAAEMISRVSTLAGSMPGASGNATSRVLGGTFHSVSSHLLRVHARDLGLAASFTILDRADAEDLMHVCRTDLELGGAGHRFPQKSTCLDIYSRCVNARETLAEALATRFPWCSECADDLSRLFDAYTDRKEEQHVLDYDDLLLFWHALLTSPAGERVRERFDHVLVDEYQDTNVLQAEIISALCPDGKGVTAVGDDAQAIYSFRAATVRNILDFEERFPDATVVTLERNHRSTGPVLSVGNALMAEAHESREKTVVAARDGGARPALVTCVDEHEQASWVTDRILERREEGVALTRQAVLFRAAHHAAVLEIELGRRDIPFVKYGGLKFVEAAHVKDLMAILRLAENPFDRIAAVRSLGLLPGVGPKTAATLADTLAGAGGDFETWVGRRVPASAAPAWADFVALMRGLASSEPDHLPAQVHAARLFYAPLCRMRYDAADARIGDLERIEAMASRFRTRERLLAELAIDPPAYTQDLAGPPLLDEEYLVLSTIHSAKGLEFDAVYVIHAADGNIPSDMSCGSAEEIDEERRLFYVACTRARDWLAVTVPVRYYVQPQGGSDRHGYAQPSRFLSPAVRRCFDEEVVGDGGPGDATTPAGGHTSHVADPRAGVRALWRA